MSEERGPHAPPVAEDARKKPLSLAAELDFAEEDEGSGQDSPVTEFEDAKKDDKDTEPSAAFRMLETELQPSRSTGSMSEMGADDRSSLGSRTWGASQDGDSPASQTAWAGTGTSLSPPSVAGATMKALHEGSDDSSIKVEENSADYRPPSPLTSTSRSSASSTQPQKNAGARVSFHLGSLDSQSPDPEPHPDDSPRPRDVVRMIGELAAAPDSELPGPTSTSISEGLPFVRRLVAPFSSTFNPTPLDRRETARDPAAEAARQLAILDKVLPQIEVLFATPSTGERSTGSADQDWGVGWIRRVRKAAAADGTVQVTDFNRLARYYQAKDGTLSRRLGETKTVVTALMGVLRIMIDKNAGGEEKEGDKQASILRAAEKLEETTVNITQEAAEEAKKQYSDELEHLRGDNTSLEKRLAEAEARLEAYAATKAEMEAIRQGRNNLTGNLDDQATLKQAQLRASDLGTEEASLRAKIQTLEQEKATYKRFADKYWDEKQELAGRLQYHMMQKLDEEVHGTTKRAAEATEKLGENDSKSEETPEIIRTLQNSLQEKTLELEAARKKGGFGARWFSSSDDTPATTEMMNTNKDLQRTVDSLQKELARIKEAYDDLQAKFEQGLDKDSLTSDDGDGSDDGGGSVFDRDTSRLNAASSRLLKLGSAYDENFSQRTSIWKGVDRAVKHGDAATEMKMRDEERRLTVAMELQKKAIADGKALEAQFNQETQRLDELLSNVKDCEAKLRGPMDDDLDKATALKQALAEEKTKLMQCRSTRRGIVLSLEQVLDEATDEKQTRLQIAEENVADLRSRNDSLERENIELKKRAARNDPLCQRVETEQHRFKKREKELEEVYQARRERLEIQYGDSARELVRTQRELLSLQDELHNAREALEGSMLRLARTQGGHSDSEDGFPNEVQLPRELADDGDFEHETDRAELLSTILELHQLVSDTRKATRTAVEAEFRARMSRLSGINGALTGLLADAAARREPGLLALPAVEERVGTYEEEYRELVRSVEPAGAEGFLDLMRRRAAVLDGAPGAAPLTAREAELAGRWCELLRCKLRFGQMYRARLWEHGNKTAAAAAWDPVAEVGELVRRFEGVYREFPDLPRMGLAGLRLLRAQVALEYLGGDSPETEAAFAALGVRARAGGRAEGEDEDGYEYEYEYGHGTRGGQRGWRGPRLALSDVQVLQTTPDWSRRLEALEARRRAWRAGRDRPACEVPRGSCGCRLQTLPCAEHASHGGGGGRGCSCHGYSITVACGRHQESLRGRGVDIGRIPASHGPELMRRRGNGVGRTLSAEEAVEVGLE